MTIVFDIGGTKMRVASSTDGKNLDNITISPTPQNYNSGLELLCEQIEKSANNQVITTIAGGVPGVLNTNKSGLVRIANLPDWSGKSLVKNLKDHFNCPVFLENDAVLGGLAEAVLGAGQGLNSITYITIGTGIGGVWIVNQKPAKENTTFEPGHNIINPNGPICVADKTAGHWEAYLRLPGEQGISPDFLPTLATGISETLRRWPADLLILGGGVSLHANWDLVQLRNNVASLLPNKIKMPQIKIAKLKDNAGLFGALLLAKQSQTS